MSLWASFCFTTSVFFVSLHLYELSRRIDLVHKRLDVELQLLRLNEAARRLQEKP